MALNPRIELRQQQRLSLTPDVLTNLSVLRMSATELDDALDAEVARNPFLIVERPRTRVGFSIAEETLAEEPGFQESLCRQIRAFHDPDDEKAVAELLVGELRNDGYLDVALEDLAKEYDLDPSLLERALRIVQRCEPAGVGARNLPECLALQLAELGLSREQANKTVALLNLFANRDFTQISSILGVTEHDVRHRSALLRQLVHKPIDDEADRPVQTLRPDLTLVRRDDGTLDVDLPREQLPLLTLDHGMVRRAKAEGALSELYDQARQLLGALAQRGQTLLRIGAWLVEHQAGFFHSGISGLCPASRTEIALELKLHPSTISRAVRGKAIDVDGRLWPLDVFFSSGLGGQDAQISSRVIRHRIAELVASETPQIPLSDDAIATVLRAEGVDIARRTVAKYRQGLRIPASSVRRRIAASKRGE